jgi:hypothetical protein
MVRELEQDVARVLAHIRATIGGREQWDRWPGGWPNDIESALVDAVFSARAVYRSRHGRGVYANVVSWQRARNRSAYSFDALVAEIDAAGIPGWADWFGNHQLAPQRPDTAPLGRSKAAAVRESASKLRQVGINVAGQVTSDNATFVRLSLQSVPGVGYVTSNYFLMLLGVPGVKPDRMIHRFLKDAAGHSFTSARAEGVLKAAAELLDAQPNELDHAIWRYQRARESSHSLRRC